MPRDRRSVTALVLDVATLALQTGAHDVSGLNLSSPFVYAAMGTIALHDVAGHSPVTILVRESERTHPMTS